MEGLGPPRTDRVNIPPAKVFAYAFLDTAAAGDIERAAEEGRPAGVVDLDEVATFQALAGVQYPDQDGSGPWFSLEVRGPMVQGDLAILVVDRNLNLRHVHNVAGKIEQFWRERWLVIIQEGKYVE